MAMTKKQVDKLFKPDGLNVYHLTWDVTFFENVLARSEKEAVAKLNKKYKEQVVTERIIPEDVDSQIWSDTEIPGDRREFKFDKQGFDLNEVS